LLRDIFGNPFHPLPTIDQGWLSWKDCRIMKLAIVVYEDRRFEDITILAEALTDAKCPDEAILSHCRQQGIVHVRGCWCLDTLLAKS
jgi:hypothetical protein